MEPTYLLYAVGALASPFLVAKAMRRLELSRAKHRSLSGHVRLGKRIASLVPYYGYGEDAFFRSDGAPVEVGQRRRAAFTRLAALYDARYPRSREKTTEVGKGVSDLQFVSRYRVPFQFTGMVQAHLQTGSFYASSEGVTLIDLDGNRFYDLSGSYGVNLFGYDFYKGTIARGSKRVETLGPVLGAYHPVLAYNVKRLREISGLDEVSFHMSGTEAVMQAVRLARFHTGRKRLVRFCGAYHGWWGDVQPGVGNPMAAPHTYTLKEMSADSLRVLRTRRDIACVLVNPLQALHPNAAAPADSSLVDSTRAARFDRKAYAAWLASLRQVCSERGIVLIFDEVFVGFRLALGGAQEYFGVRADLVTYGKTLGGGFPVGVVCGRADLMRRYRDRHPVDICFARGTFNSHPYVMGAMAEFLEHLETPAVQRMYAGLDERWNALADRMNARLQEADVPVRVANLSSIWTVYYTQPSRYNWMLQYYLRAAGLALSWVGTGRIIFSLDYSDADLAQVVERFVSAARAMEQDGWWWSEAMASNKSIKRQVLREVLGHAVGSLRSRVWPHGSGTLP